MFGAQYYIPGSEGREHSSIRLRPGLDDANAWVELAENIVDGESYDIEFARLKVKNGENAGKYYVYFKINGELISESYVAEGVVDSKGNYKSNPGNADCTISNVIYMTAWGASGTIISASPFEETYYDYDEVTYNDLLLNKKPLTEAKTDIGSTRRFTYNVTSDTYSAVLTYRWTAGTDPHYVLFFDAWGGSAYPFCLAVKRPGFSGLGEAAGENGAWHVDPSVKDHIVQMSTPIVAGNDYDTEYGRLKVKTGPNKNKYYVYLKINGEMIYSYYYAGVKDDGTYGNGGTLSENIIFTSGASDSYISAIPIEETYEAYDEVTYYNFLKDGKPLSDEYDINGQKFTYNKTSDSGSAIISYRWKGANVGSNFYISFDPPPKTSDPSKSATEYSFGIMYTGTVDGAPNGKVWLRIGNGSRRDLDEALVMGNDYDIEFARLKVATGPNKGKYKLFFRITDVASGQVSYYEEKYIEKNFVDGNGQYVTDTDGAGKGVTCTISNSFYITFWGNGGGNKIAPIPFKETYEDYDVIGYADLYKDGNPVPEKGTKLSGGTVFTYNRTSPTGSAILKYRWNIGDVAKFQLSFEKALDKNSSRAISYMFGAWLAEPGAQASYPDGKMWLRPGYGPEVALTEPLAAGSSHNVEFARLKVKDGPNTGKYYVYVKIDDVLLAEDYVQAGIVDENLGYYTKPNEDIQCSMASNEIFLAFWGSEGNGISAYKEPGVNVHEGTRGDLDDDGTIGATDFDTLKDVLFGRTDMSEKPEGIADFNNDVLVDIVDLIAVKKHMAPVNTYEKPGDLSVGTQEHLLEDATKTAAYIADASAVLGADIYRLSIPIHQLYYATSTNGVSVKADGMSQLKEMIAALKAQGINEILYVTDSFILPYGYSDPSANHNKTVPDPVTDAANYMAWLTVNSLAFGELAKECPEIKFFEPYNEINVLGSRLETYGIGWNATAEEQAAHRFTVAEKAAIMADLCWYVSKEVKAVDIRNQVTTPSISLSNNSIVEGEFLDALYSAIESGNYPTGQTLGDKRIDNYFTIVNIHLYPNYADSNLQTKVNSFAASIDSGYAVMQAHNDGGSRVWLTETGVSSYHGDGTPRTETTAATLMGLTLNKIDSDLNYIDTVITYKLADISSDNGATLTEAGYGLFYSGDDLDHDPYTAKPIAKTVYSFTHAGSTDYSELDALVGRYN